MHVRSMSLRVGLGCHVAHQLMELRQRLLPPYLTRALRSPGSPLPVNRAVEHRNFVNEVDITSFIEVEIEINEVAS